MNFSKLAAAADLSVPTLKKYLLLLEKTYMVRLLAPLEANLKKRLIKAPKMYLRDSGILHSLLEIERYDQLLSHPVNGPSFEGYAIENILGAMPRHRPSFIRTSNGAEVDLVLERGGQRTFFEIKLSSAPKLSRGFHALHSVLDPVASWLVAPVSEPYEIAPGVRVVGPGHLGSVIAG